MFNPRRSHLGSGQFDSSHSSSAYLSISQHRRDEVFHLRQGSEDTGFEQDDASEQRALGASGTVDRTQALEISLRDLRNLHEDTPHHGPGKNKGIQIYPNPNISQLSLFFQPTWPKLQVVTPETAHLEAS